jgi:predicted nucleic-acid-binding Zn-ribbon protein
MSKKHNTQAQKFQETFRCAKCHGKESIIRRVSLSTSSLTGFLPLVSDKFYSVTCVLCGYTELYDESVYGKQFKRSQEDLRATQEA